MKKHLWMLLYLIFAFVLAVMLTRALECPTGDILSELEKPARDPREELPKPVLRSDVLEMKDLKPGMKLKGTVRNVVDFGAFVDIGVHEDGLVHISRMSDRFIKHPLEVVSVGDVVDVTVLEVDEKKGRISLTMKEDNAPKDRKKTEKTTKERPSGERKLGPGRESGEKYAPGTIGYMLSQSKKK